MKPAKKTRMVQTSIYHALPGVPEPAPLTPPVPPPPPARKTAQCDLFGRRDAANVDAQKKDCH